MRKRQQNSRQSICERGQGDFVPEVSMCLNAGGMGRIDGESETFVPVATAFHSRQDPITADDVMLPLEAKQGQCVTSALAVRRLTPAEAERLQGFPDEYTLIKHRGKPAADGPRCKALGNSMAVPVLRWILTRAIAQLEAK
jgi:DNA (cytosine-5)-methyltransferase 1